MIEDTYNHDEKELLKLNKNQYKNRFGINYSFKKIKSLDINNNDFFKMKRIKRFNSKIYKSKDSSRYNSLTKSESSFRGKSTRHNNLYNEKDKIELNKIYGNFEKESEEILPIHYFTKVSNCSIVKYGIKKSPEEIEYSFCKTCDHNLLKPICISCINQCHSGHSIKYIFNKGRIKCCCGEKNHIGMKIKDQTNNNNEIKCLCNEWNITAKFNFYYINEKNEPICILCHNFCQDNKDNDKLIKIEENQTIPNCSCKNEEIHNDSRIIYEKILLLSTNSNEFDILLHPIQIINMIFKSTNNFKMIFEYFLVFMNNLINSNNSASLIGYFSKINLVDVTYTNIYKTLCLFEKIIKKIPTSNDTCFFNENIINYFSFHNIKKLIVYLKESSIDEKIFLILINKYLYLFHKIYINTKTQSLEKYKLNDLKNLSFCQRIINFNENKKKFKESEEIVSFLLKFLIDITYKGFSSIESVDCIKEIISILRKLSCYDLIYISDMTRICVNIYKCFNNLRIIRNSFKKNLIDSKMANDVNSKKDSIYFNRITLKIYYIIIKMFMNFIYNYNDNIIKRILYDKEKYTFFHNIGLNNVCFIYKKNELGRLIFKITICILTSIQKNYNNFENKKTILIQRVGIKIIQFSLIKSDDYILNIIDSLNKFKNYFEKSKKLKINNYQYYKELNKHCALISKSYYQYFNFEISILELLEIVNDSLNFVLGDSIYYIDNILSYEGNEIHKEFNQNQILSIISTNYFSLICKVFNIIYNYQKRKTKLESIIEDTKKKFDDSYIGKSNIFEKNNIFELNNLIQYIPINIEDEIIKKILYFYFCFTLNSSDNSFLILTHYIFNELIKLPLKYCQLVFKLFYFCFKNVLSTEQNNIITAEKSYIIKRLYKYLIKLINEKHIKQNTLLFCIYYFLQLIEMTIFNSQSSLFNNFIYKIQNMIFSINKNYNLVDKFFEMKDKDFNIHIRTSSSKNNIFEIKKMTTNVGNIFNNKRNDNTFGFQFYQRNILKRSIFIFMKLINDCFDFSLEVDRKKIEEMINVDKVIFSLRNYKINLDLRTEFMRFLRKFLLDLKYSESENDLFSKAIIKYKDSFNFIKNNNLINNMGYPTRLLSFLYDFYNITSKCSLKEKLKTKIKKKNIEKFVFNGKEKSKADKTIYETADSFKSDNFDFMEDINEKALKKKTFYQNENYLNNVNEIIENGKCERDDKLKNESQSIKYRSMKRLCMVNNKNEDKLSEIRKKFYKEVIKSKLENYKRNESLKDLSIKEKPTKDQEEDELSNLDKNKYLKMSNISNGIILEESFSKGDNDSDESKLKNSNINKSNKSISKLSDIKYKSQNRLSITKSTNKLSGKFHSSNTLNIINDSKNQNEDKNEEDDKSDINIEDLIDLFYIIDYNDNEDFFWKCRRLNIFEDAFNEKFYSVINNELNNSKNHIKNIKLNTPEKIEYVKNYIENGLLIPIIFYFKKIFTLVSSFSGEEMIKLCSLVEKCLNFKLYLYDLKSDFWTVNFKEESSYKNNDKNLLYDMNEVFNPQKYYYSKGRFASIIDESYFIDSKSICSTYESLDLIKSNKISMFDYSSLYQIIEKEFFVLIKERKLLNIKKLFKEQNNEDSLNRRKIKEEEKLLNYKHKYNSDIQKRLLRTFIIYKYGKIFYYSEHSSSFFSILSEVSLGYETNYRNLLIKLLINYGKNNDIKDEFVEISYFLLFKLQCAQTMETQNEIINILGGLDSEDCGFLEEFSQILLCRITLLIMDFLNPADKLFQTNYFVTCNLINIFKYLCIEHNYFFQFHLVKSLSYNSCRTNFSFFKFNIVEEDNNLFINKETEIIDNIKIINQKEVYNIKFYDFFLFLLTKIILISNWENNGNNNFNPNPFLYDLFSSILDLLTEIIQGSKPELLSILFDNIDQKILDILGKGFDPEKFKKTESFEIFTKSIINILFEEKYDLKLIFEIKNIIMHYITSILEEKNCNETMRKYIKKHLNINNIYAHIIKVMKLYFLNKQNPKKFDKIKKQIAGLIPKKIFILNKGKPPRKQRNSVVGLESRPKINPELTKTLKMINIPEHSSSKVNLISTMIDINKDLKKHLASSKFQKNLEENKHFLNILPIRDNSEDNPIKGTKTIKEVKNNNNNKNKNNSFALELKISKLTFGKKLYDYFKKQFYEDPKFVESMEFQLINSFYRFIKIITLKQNVSDKKTTMKNLQKITDLHYEEEDKLLEKKKEDENNSKKNNLNNNLNYEKDIVEKYYIEKFFEKITTTVEVRTSEGINKTVIFTRLPAMQLLSEGTKNEFKRNVNRDNETSKKNDLMKYIEYFIKEIKYYKKYNNKWDVWFSKINFNYLELISHIFAIFYNLILLFTIKGDIQITGSDTLKDRRQNKMRIMHLIDISIYKWHLVYYFFNWIYLALNGIFIFLWMRYKLPLYYREDKINYREIFKKDKHKRLNIFEKIYVLIKMCIFGRNYIKMLIYEFILCIICLIVKRSEILYPFLIIPIIFINKTLKNIIISIRLNFKQFCLTFCFAFIIIYVFSNLYFFYLNSDFENELNYYNDNYCKTLIFAFLNALDNGLRARGGLGDSAKRISFLKNKNHYLLRLILDDFFFIFIVIIMIDMVFGIIVKSFDELRYRNQKFHTDKKNHCFICHSHRNTLEKMRKDFNEHVKKTHNVWNYVEYMIWLKFKDVHDLNAVNQYVRGKMDRKDISWFPTYKDNEENDIDFEDKNLSVYHEKVENYKMKYINVI